jgi:hypothetical protein
MSRKKRKIEPIGFPVNIDPMTDVPSTLLAVQRDCAVRMRHCRLICLTEDTGGNMRWIRQARDAHCGRRLHAMKLTL